MSESVAGTIASNASTLQTTASGRGGGRTNGRPSTNGGRSNRNNRNNRQNNRTNRISNPNAPRGSFKGSNPDMNGHVFECYEERGDRTQFPRTLEALGEYAAKEFKFPEDLKSMFREPITAPVLVEPADLSDDAGARETIIWEVTVKTFGRRTDELRSNLMKLYTVIWGQCSEAMRTKIRALSQFTVENRLNNCIWLLGEIKGVTHQFDTKRNMYLSLLDARIAYFTCKQTQNQTNADYLEVFTSHVQVLEYYKANIGESYLLVDSANGTYNTVERTQMARGLTIAMAFLRGADPRRYSTLWSDLANQQTRGNDQYPVDLTTAYALLVNYHAPNPNRQQQQQQAHPSNASIVREQNNIPTDIGAHTFAQAARTTSASASSSSGKVAGTDGVMHPDITCFSCNKMGHYASACTSAISLLQHAHMLTQNGSLESYNAIPKHWILLDSQSNMSVFNNKNIITNIRTSPQAICATTNGGIQTSTLIGDFRNLGTVWYNPDSIANILSLRDVRQKCKVTMDTSVENAMIVHRQDGSIMKFKEHLDGLYYFDIHADRVSVSISPVTLVNTVYANKQPFVTRDIDLADKARELYRKLGRPSQLVFETILKKNLITNCPVTVDDAKRALIIYGPDLAAIKGKTTRGKLTPHVPSFVAVPIPAPILEHHHQVTLCVDFFFVQGQAFLHTISRNIQHRIVDAVPDRTKVTIIKHLNKVLRLYHSRGFTITDLHADNEFECIRDHILPINLNTVAADGHVGEVERSIRTIKERNRSTVHGLPFRRIPKLMVREIVKHSVTCLNQLPADDGVSDTLSPLTIMTGKPNPDFNTMQLEFGSYVQIFEPTTFSTNTLRSRTTGAITLTHTGNTQGDYFFMSLITGRRLSRHQWTAIPMNDNAIERVEQMAAAEDQPWIQSTGLLVEWRPHTPFDDDDDPDYVYTDEVDDDDDDSYDWDDAASDDLTISTDNLTDNDDELFPPPSIPIPDPEPETMINAPLDIIVEQNEVLLAPTPPVVPPPRYNLRPSRDRKYDHRLDHIMDSPDTNQSYDHPVQLLNHTTKRVLTAYVFTQMSAAAGIKVYGQPAVDAIFKEFTQLHDKNVFDPKHASSLTHAQRRASLRAVNLIKEKRTGEIKGRTCADGSVQRSLFEKSETTSPTVANDALMLSILIDAKERRDVATADVVGAYLNADMDQFTLMKLTGEAVDIMVRVDKTYAAYVSQEKGKPVLYLQLKKALYGCVKSALLWYDLFVNTLKDMGFELNPYDACVANKVINGTQCTIVWYVDDNKISHIDPKVVSDVILKIEERFGKMTVTRGNKHSFLGMNFTFNKNFTVSISMKEYLKECISESKLNIAKAVSSPAKKDLFDIDDTSPLLPTVESESFHSTVAKLLFVSLRARPDILLAISFLCTRVSKSTTQDQLKLQRLLEYINGSLDIILTLGADDLSTLHTWVDASYAVHPDMKSHTGGIISMGTGGLLCKSTKQKLNTKSSTEAELVGATDYLPSTIWSKMFLEAQGHNITNNFFEQDNVSAIRLEKNGRASAGKQSRHIDIRYFFMKDRVKTDNITIQHCPTEQMLADFLTKPLQGSLFRKFRDVLLGYKHISSLKQENSSTSVPEERVEISEDEWEVLQETDVDNYVPAVADSAGSSTSCNDSSGGTWSMVVGRRKKRTAPTGPCPANNLIDNSKGVVCKVVKAHNFANNPQ
jgi:hypothetical protein